MITVKVHDQCGTVILDRPACCNALNRQMIAELRQALDDLHQEKRVRGIVLTGAGPHFCSGLDIKQLYETSTSQDAMQQWFSDAQSVQGLLQQMLQCPKPLVAAVDGKALGTGLSLVLACDLVVASHRASFAVPAARLGLVSGFVVPLLSFRMGSSLTSRLTLGGDELPAGEARELGLVHRLVESHEVWVRASNWVESMAAGAAESLQLTKKVLNEMVGESLFTMLSSGAAATATALTTEAAMEGLSAFAEKREPSFPS